MSTPNSPIQNGTVKLQEVNAIPNKARTMSYPESVEIVEGLSKQLTMRGLLNRVSTVCNLRAEQHVSQMDKDSADMWSKLASKLSKLAQSIDD